MLTESFHTFAEQSGADYFPRYRPLGVASVSRGRPRPGLVAGTRPEAAPADDLDLDGLDDDTEPGERAALITELIDLIGDDPVNLVDALNDLDRVPAAQRGGSLRNRIEGRAAAIEAGFRSRGQPIDPALVDQLARDAVRVSSGWRESAPTSGIALIER